MEKDIKKIDSTDIKEISEPQIHGQKGPISPTERAPSKTETNSWSDLVESNRKRGITGADAHMIWGD